MKNSIKRKELQAKLNHHISEFAGTLIKKDSKKLKKSIKKASKLIAKAILKNSEESEVAVSLIEKKAAVPSKRIIKIREKTISNRRRPIVRKQNARKGKTVKPIFKSNGGLTNISPEEKIEKKEVVK